MAWIADTSWHVFLWNQKGKRILTALVEEDAELVAKLKLLASELRFRVEVREVFDTAIERKP